MHQATFEDCRFQSCHRPGHGRVSLPPVDQPQRTGPRFLLVRVAVQADVAHGLQQILHRPTVEGQRHDVVLFADLRDPLRHPVVVDGRARRRLQVTLLAPDRIRHPVPLLMLMQCLPRLPEPCLHPVRGTR